MNHPQEPTGEQCEQKHQFTFEGKPAMACWYPQMGGYVAKCVIVTAQSDPGGCFDAYVWHDGSFPFTGDDTSSLRCGACGQTPNPTPAHIHHCDPDQFYEFGLTVGRFLSGPAT